MNIHQSDISVALNYLSDSLRPIVDSLTKTSSLDIGEKLTTEALQLGQICMLIRQREDHISKVNRGLKECTMRLILMGTEMGPPSFCLDDCECEWDSQYEPFITNRQSHSSQLSNIPINDEYGLVPQEAVFEEFMTRFSFFQQQLSYFTIRGLSPVRRKCQPTCTTSLKSTVQNIELLSNKQNSFVQQLIVILGIMSIISKPFSEFICKLKKFEDSWTCMEEGVKTLRSALRKKTERIDYLEAKIAENSKEWEEKEKRMKKLLEESDSSRRDLVDKLSRSEVIYTLMEGDTHVKDDETVNEEIKFCGKCEIYLKHADELETELDSHVEEIEDLKKKNCDLLNENAVKSEQINELFVEIDRLVGVVGEKESTVKELEERCASMRNQFMTGKEVEDRSEEIQSTLMKEIEVLREMLRNSNSENVKLRNNQRTRMLDYEIPEILQSEYFINQRPFPEFFRLGDCRLLGRHRDRLVEFSNLVETWNLTLHGCQRTALQGLSCLQNFPFLVSSCFHLIFRLNRFVDIASKRMESLSVRLSQFRNSRVSRILLPIVEANDTSELSSYVNVESDGSLQSLHIETQEKSPGYRNLSIFYKSIFSKLKDKLDREILTVLSLQRENKDLNGTLQKARDEKNVLYIKLSRCELLNSYLRKKHELMSQFTTEDANTLPHSLYKHMESKIRELSQDRLQLRLKLLNCQNQLTELSTLIRSENNSSKEIPPKLTHTLSHDEQPKPTCITKQKSKKLTKKIQ